MRRTEDEQEKICFYCEYSIPIADTDVCVCSQKGVVNADAVCRKFRLDLLKVKPKQPLVFEGSESSLAEILKI